MLAEYSGVLVILTLAALIGANRLWFEPRVRDSVEAARIVRVMHEAMLDQETALRGFIVTRQSEFLDPYQAGRSQLRVLTPQIEELLAGRSDIGAIVIAGGLASIPVWVYLMK